jgi:hypothetical protein
MVVVAVVLVAEILEVQVTHPQRVQVREIVGDRAQALVLIMVEEGVADLAVLGRMELVLVEEMVE